MEIGLAAAMLTRMSGGETGRSAGWTMFSALPDAPTVDDRAGSGAHWRHGDTDHRAK